MKTNSEHYKEQHPFMNINHKFNASVTIIFCNYNKVEVLMKCNTYLGDTLRSQLNIDIILVQHLKNLSTKTQPK
jgi:hypothetical protein